MIDSNNIASALEQQARFQPDGIALIVPKQRVGERWIDERFSYRQLDDLSTRLAAGIQANGIVPGTRVAFMVPPSLEFFALFFALFKAGCVPVLIDPGIGTKSLKACLGEACPEVFIGISRAQLARMLLGWARDHVRKTITVGPRPFWRGLGYRDLMRCDPAGFVPPVVGPDDPAAILFTSGSTGIPKGVVYRHRHFASQVRLVREAYSIQPGEIDLPTFPPFALFDPALGMTTVIPTMDFTRPARVDPDMLVSLIRHYRVTNLFGSPALMDTLTRHLDARSITLPTLNRVLSAGAPVPPRVVERMHRALRAGADIHTPYGATECLPVATISGRELAEGLSQANRRGQGICVGKPLDANRVWIIRINDQALLETLSAISVAAGEIGEICVAGPTATDTYWRREAQTRLAKMVDARSVVWHRMGDLGRFDEQGRLWYCGRKSERVETADGTLYTECIEGRINAISGVNRSALVGVGETGRQVPVVIVEPESDRERESCRIKVAEAMELYSETASIRHLLLHASLPVDIRHNAKIKRGSLAAWAALRLPAAAIRRG